MVGHLVDDVVVHVSLREVSSQIAPKWDQMVENIRPPLPAVAVTMTTMLVALTWVVSLRYAGIGAIGLPKALMLAQRQHRRIMHEPVERRFFC